jgi:putative tributyrin esterase
MALIHVDFFSEVLGMSAQMEVILPIACNGQIGIGEAQKQKKYPVLYLLHGMTDNATAWQRNTSIERYAVEKGIAVVMPDCHLGWYTNMKYGFPYFDYICKEVPDVCRRFFPCLSKEREDNFVAGNSMGGYGAFKLGLSAPEQFAAAASLSGAMDMVDTLTNRQDDAVYPDFWQDIFGTREEFSGGENDLFAVSGKLIKCERPAPKLYMWCGTEDFLYQQNMKMHSHLEMLGYDLTYKETKGNHGWEYWDVWIRDVLDWLPIRREEEM